MQLVLCNCIYFIGLNTTDVRKVGVSLQGRLEQTNKQKRGRDSCFLDNNVSQTVFSPPYKQDIKLYFSQEIKGSPKLLIVPNA